MSIIYYTRPCNLKDGFSLAKRRGDKLFFDKESEDDVMCVASPIFDYTGNVIAGLSISGPITRITLEKIKQDYSRLIVKATADVSKELGYNDMFLK